MKLYEAYKARPLKSNRIQLYEFRGVSIVRDESGDSKGKPISAFMGQKRSYMPGVSRNLNRCHTSSAKKLSYLLPGQNNVSDRVLH